MVGGPWPDRHIRPQTSTVLVLNKARTVVRRATVTGGVFEFALPKGDYQVSARLDQLICGPPERVSIPSAHNGVLHFICPIK
jgi:hypothetical protein